MVSWRCTADVLRLPEDFNRSTAIKAGMQCRVYLLQMPMLRIF